MRTYSNMPCVILWLCVFATVVFPFGNSKGLAQEATDRETLLFVGDVLTKTEYKVTNGGRVVRWKEAPTLSTFGDQDRHQPVVTQTLREINRAMPENLQVTQLKDEDDAALIKLYFIKLDAFEEIAKQHGFETVAGNRGLFYITWDRDFEIKSSVILIAEDKLSGKSLSHFVLEEVVQSMGLGGDSKRFPKSVFYEDETRFRYGSATRLAPIDRKLIRFLYEHVPAGSVPIEVGQLFEKHWQD